MPSELEYIIVGALVVVGSIYAGLVLGEGGRDERGIELRAKTARAGYLAGIILLMLGVLVPVVTGGHVNVWVLTALGAMIAARFFVRMRTE